MVGSLQKTRKSVLQAWISGVFDIQQCERVTMRCIFLQATSHYTKYSVQNRSSIYDWRASPGLWRGFRKCWTPVYYKTFPIKHSHYKTLPITKYSNTDWSGGQWGRTEFLLTSILSQSMIVSSLWAMVRTVHSWNLSRIVCWMRLSVLKEQGTQHLNTKTSLPIHPWAGGLPNTEQWLISSEVYAVVGTKEKR